MSDNVPKFKPGDIVALPSGGPHMTVAYCEDDDGIPAVVVVWFTILGADEAGEPGDVLWSADPNRMKIPPEALVLIEADS